MINQTSTSCKNCMVLIRMLVLKGLVENVRIYAKHVKGTSNILANSLSRNKLQLFHKDCEKIGKCMEESNTPVPQQLWPMQNIWKY